LCGVPTAAECNDVASLADVLICARKFLFALMMTTSTGSRTWPVGLQLMVGEFQLPWGTLGAGGIISIIPLVLLRALIQRTLVGGFTAGAAKREAALAIAAGLPRHRAINCTG